jgi:hypothetical protein
MCVIAPQHVLSGINNWPSVWTQKCNLCTVTLPADCDSWNLQQLSINRATSIRIRGFLCVSEEVSLVPRFVTLSFRAQLKAQIVHFCRFHHYSAVVLLFYWFIDPVVTNAMTSFYKGKQSLSWSWACPLLWNPKINMLKLPTAGPCLEPYLFILYPYRPIIIVEDVF